jgi:nicotinamidase-related amidase
MPTTSALLIIDVQRALCTGAEAAFGIAGVLDRINALSAQAREAGVPVVVVQHEDQETLEFDTPGWQLADGLVIAPEDLRIRKRTPNSFHNTPLQPLLQERGVERLVICGLQTEFCVDTTVRQALPLGYRVVLAADAHSTIDGPLSAAQVIAHHNHTFRHMTSFGPVLTVTPAAEITF